MRSSCARNRGIGLEPTGCEAVFGQAEPAKGLGVDVVTDEVHRAVRQAGVHPAVVGRTEVGMPLLPLSPPFIDHGRVRRIRRRTRVGDRRDSVHRPIAELPAPKANGVLVPAVVVPPLVIAAVVPGTEIGVRMQRLLRHHQRVRRAVGDLRDADGTGVRLNHDAGVSAAVCYGANAVGRPLAGVARVVELVAVRAADRLGGSAGRAVIHRDPRSRNDVLVRVVPGRAGGRVVALLAELENGGLIQLGHDPKRPVPAMQRLGPAADGQLIDTVITIAAAVGQVSVHVLKVVEGEADLLEVVLAL